MTALLFGKPLKKSDACERLDSGSFQLRFSNVSIRFMTRTKAMEISMLNKQRKLTPFKTCDEQTQEKVLERMGDNLPENPDVIREPYCFCK